MTATHLAESRLAEGALGLATALGRTPTGLVENPQFFSGFLARPDIAAAGLLAVADVAGHRYADAGLAKRIANLDPVVTASGDRLRFESFSACNGVHARFDLLRDGLGSAEIGFGTTNVDINLPLRKALARVERDEPLHLSVGPDELRTSSLAETLVERKVALPDRWVRGFAEVPALTRGMTLFGQVQHASIARFLSSLPRVAPPGPQLHIVTHAGQWRTTGRAVSGSAPLPGASRLRAADRIARHATSLTVHTSTQGSTAWVFTLPGARFTLVLTPDPFRGFSGEGTLLTLLTDPHGEESGRRLLPHLSWSTLVDPDRLAARAGQSPDRTTAGLAWLAASGRLGWDLTDGAWFHRELPIDAERVLRRNPRLVAARTLVTEGGITSTAGGWRVRGSHGERYRVTHALTCECAWYLEHDGLRGPCKHVLAALITETDTVSPSP